MALTLGWQPEEQCKWVSENGLVLVELSPRWSAVMYCLSALQRFEKMTPEEVRKIGFEIAMLGQKGLDTNDTAQKYRLKNMSGQFTGLQLLCLMYVAFKKVAPDKDIGFDLTKEFEIAKTMHKKGEGK